MEFVTDNKNWKLVAATAILMKFYFQIELIESTSMNKIRRITKSDIFISRIALWIRDTYRLLSIVFSLEKPVFFPHRREKVRKKKKKRLLLSAMKTNLFVKLIQICIHIWMKGAKEWKRKNEKKQVNDNKLLLIDNIIESTLLNGIENEKRKKKKNQKKKHEISYIDESNNERNVHVLKVFHY